MDGCSLPPLVGDTDLLTKAKSLELGAFGMNNDLISRTYSLDDLLEAAYKIRCPEPYEHENRRDLIRIFNIIAKELYGNGCPVVEEFGSFVMNMFSSESDLDLTINFNNDAAAWSKKQRVNALRRFAKKFRSLENRGIVKDVQLVPTARVPVLKVTDQGTNIECDFSVENRDGVTKSHIVFIIATIDERLRKLSIMLKAWAKAHSINSSKDGTLNSLSLVLLAAFHLQCSEPPILPPFSAFLKDGYDLPTVQKNVALYVNYGEKNKESLVQLFVTLLIRLKSVETLWSEGLCASVYEGSWIQKKFKNKLGIYVEDFTDRSQNVARALTSKNVRAVYQSIDKSVSQFQNFLDGKIQWNLLERSLFGLRPPRMTKNIITLQTTQLAQKHEVGPPHTAVLHDTKEGDERLVVLDTKKKKKKKMKKRREKKETPISTKSEKQQEQQPRKPVIILETGERASFNTTHDPTHIVSDNKKKRRKKRKETLVSPKSEGQQQQQQQQPRKRVIIPETGGQRIRSHEVEAFERRASCTTTQNPSLYIHNYAPPFGGHEAASSSQSFAPYPPTLPYPSYPRNVPYHHPSQYVARYPPIRDPVYDPYYPQASQSVSRVAVSPYPTRREHYRTPEDPYLGRREHYRIPEDPYPRRLERIWSDYSREVRREAPYPGRAQTWCDRPDEAPRGGRGPPFYRY